MYIKADDKLQKQTKNTFIFHILFATNLDLHQKKGQGDMYGGLVTRHVARCLSLVANVGSAGTRRRAGSTGRRSDSRTARWSAAMAGSMLTATSDSATTSPTTTATGNE